jgi:hypothetical protein
MHHTITIFEGSRFRLDSTGNRLGLTLVDKLNGMSVWVQDNDASQMSDEYGALEVVHPNDIPDDILGILWFDFGYGSVATKSEY